MTPRFPNMLMDRRLAAGEQSFRDRVLGLLETIKESDGELNEGIKDALEELDPFQLDRAEDELMEAGVTRDDLMLLCDARVKINTKAEVIEEAFLERPGHPIHTLMEEHRQILLFMTEVRDQARELRAGKRSEEETTRLQEVEPFLTEAQKHFQREENVLFPYLERHGIEGPPAAMWSEHEVLRANEKELMSLIARERYMERKEFLETLEYRSTTLLALLNSHFHKENEVLFPMSIRALGVHEWNDARLQFQVIGPCNFGQPHAPSESPIEQAGPVHQKTGEIVLPTGRFTVNELEMVLNSLPVDFTFVDRDDKVRYYSGSPDRIFARTPAVIGRRVQNCHPQKSVHVVERILEEFKAGTRDQAEFWIELKGQIIHIRYFPLKDKAGNYNGVVEMAQDVTAIRKLKGEKRLLDEGEPSHP